MQIDKIYSAKNMPSQKSPNQTLQFLKVKKTHEYLSKAFDSVNNISHLDFNINIAINNDLPSTPNLIQNDQPSPINDNSPRTIQRTKPQNFNKNIKLICRQKSSSELFPLRKDLASNISATPINSIRTTKISYPDSTREASNSGIAPSISPSSSSNINIYFRGKGFWKLDAAMACSASWPIN